MLVETGIISLSGVSAGRFVSSDPIDLTRLPRFEKFSLWSCITGDPGATGSGVSITWMGCFKRSGTTYYTPTSGVTYIRNSGTSVNGPRSNGVALVSFTLDASPFIKIKARHGGSATTSTAYAAWALMAV